MMRVVHVIWLCLVTWVAVLSLGAVVVVAGTVNVWLSALAWPFAQVQGFAAQKIRALK
jgi:hypothetical protein